MAGLTFPSYRYYPDTLRVSEACIEWFKLGFYEEPGNPNNRSSIPHVYEREARMTVVHELFHAVQAALREYVYLDEDVERSSAWIDESSASAVEYFYEGFLDAYVTRGDNTTLTIMSRMAENIVDYFSGALYTVDPFRFSLESYDYYYDRLYDYTPFFIWLFQEKGIGVIRDFYSTPDPRESQRVKDYLEEFLHSLPQGFVYETSNKTQVLYPRAHPLQDTSTLVTVDSNAAQYLRPLLEPGRYRATLEGGGGVVSLGVTYLGEGLSIVNPGEFVVRNDTVLSLVNTGNAPVTVRLVLEYQGPAGGEEGGGAPLATVTVTETLRETTTSTVTKTLLRETTSTVTETLTLRETIVHTETLVRKETVTRTLTTTVDQGEGSPSGEKTITLTVTATQLTQGGLPTKGFSTVTVTETSTVTVTETLSPPSGSLNGWMPVMLLLALVGLLTALLARRG